MSSGYGSGQRMPAQQTYEAPACVQNAMMTKDKKPFTYTPGGIDLSQIKSERMAKRLARNAQAEGATGQQQQNRPTVSNQSPGSASPNAAASMGAAAMGMPFQVLPPPPPPAPGKNFNGGSAPAPPPPPPSSSSNFSNTGTKLAPPTNGSAGGRGSAPNSPSMPRKSPTPQRFEPPPMGFRPEIKIPPNPMAALRKVPPPVEKNTFWKDEYVKERSKSPMVESQNNNSSGNNNSNNSSYNLEQNNDSVNSASSSPQTTTNANSNGTATMNNDNIDGFKKTMPTTTTNNNNVLQQNQTNNNYTNYQPQQQQQQQIYTPPTPPQQSPIKPMQHSTQYNAVPSAPATPSQPQPQQQTQYTQQQSPQQQQQQTSRPEFRSVAAPTSPAVNVYTRQTDSPRSVDNATPPRVSESPFRFAQQQQQQQQKAPAAISPLAQQSSPSTASSGASVSPSNQAQTVPWRTQRSQQPQQQAQPVVAQSHPQPIYNNVQPQQQQQRTPDFSTQTAAYQGPKPTNVGSLYIAPLAPPTEPQAQHIVRQQLQQQQQQRDSPMRQMPSQQQQQQPTGVPTQQLRWMSSQPVAKEQPAWARPEENGNVVPSSLNRIKSPPPSSAQQQQQPQQHLYQQPLSQGNGFMPPSAPQNFGAQPMNSTGLRLQINSPPLNQANQNGPKERIIPIQLEQTPTYTPTQPSFAPQQQQYGAGSNPPAPGYVMRTPNQFVDQGYNNFGQQQQQQPTQPQRVMSPTLQQLNAPRMVQQTQNNVVAGNKTHIIPIALDSSEGTRGPISKTPIVIQNDQRTPPVQSKSFRILQKITDTIDDGSNDDNNANQQQQQQQPVEPQLQRPTFARQMSAQQARHSPTVEQMRRMQIGHEQDNSQQYLPPSEQQAPEPKKYTGSAIPSRSFKILQAMTQPENADEQENSENISNNKQNNNEMNEIESKPESNDNNNRYSYASNASSTVEPVSSCSSSSINSELAFSSSPSPTPPPTQPIAYPPYPYPYAYPWYPPPPTHITQQNGENCSVAPPTCYYPYPLHAATPPPGAVSGESSHPYPPYPYYYPYPYPIPPPPPPPAATQMSPYSSAQNSSSSVNQTSDYDLHNIYAPYLPPPPPYIAYPYPVAPSYSQSSSSSRASSMLPDIIITPSTDDVPSQVIMKHHIKVDKDSQRPQRAGSIEIEDVSSLKSNPPSVPPGSVVDVLSQHLENMSKSMENNLNSKQQAKKSYKKNIAQKSPEENTSPVQISMIREENEQDSEEESSDSEITPKQNDKKGPVPLKSIRSVNNVQIYKQQNLKQDQEDEESSSESETETESEEEEEDDDETTADGESDIFDEEEDEVEPHDYEMEQRVEEDSDGSEEFIMDDSLSVIYEEESEMEKSSDMAKTVIRGDRSSQSTDLSLTKDDPPDDLEHKIEDNDMDDDQDEEEEREDSTSVTVRLPLKFSFSTSKDDENIATIEVGKSQIEERRNSINLAEKRNSFSVATVKSDTEDEEEENNNEDCDVSVTISLSNSSKSNSWADKKEIKSNEETVGETQQKLNVTIAEDSEAYEEESEDVSVSFSLNMRNKFAHETLNDGITNNIAMVEETSQTEEQKSKETLKKVEPKSEEIEVQKSSEAHEELDFFATLMATKMQAQKIKEQSASYWGKFQQNKEGTQEKEEISLSEVKKEEINNETVNNNEVIKESVTKEEVTNVEVSIEEIKKNEIHDSQQLDKDLESKEAKINFWNNFPTTKETAPQNEKEENKLKKVDSKTTVSSANKTKVKSKKETKTKKIIKSKKEEANIESTKEVKIEKETKQKETKTLMESSVAKETQDLESKESKINFWNKYSTKGKIETETKVEVTTTETLSPKIQLTEDISFTKSQETSKPQICSNDKTETKSEEKNTKVDLVTNTSEQEPVKKPKFSFWDRCESLREKEKSQTQKPKEEKVQLQKPKEVLDVSFWERYSTPVRQLEVTTEKAEESKKETKVEETKSWEHDSTTASQLEVKSEKAEEEETKTDEIEDIWAGRDEDVVVKKPVTSFVNNYSKPEETENVLAAKESEDVVDIWADRVEDLPPIKPLKTKLKSLETAKESFWSTVSEANKETPTDTETEIEKPLPKAEIINRIEFKVKLHSFSLKEAEVKPQNASEHFEEVQIEQESTLHQEEESDEIDFWAQIEKCKESKESESKRVVHKSSYYNNFEEQETSIQQASNYTPLEPSVSADQTYYTFDQDQQNHVPETSYNYTQEEQQTSVPESSYNYSEEEQQTPVPETSCNYAVEEQQTPVPETSYNYAQEEQQTSVPESSYNYSEEEQQTPVPEASYSNPLEEVQQTPVQELSYNYSEEEQQQTPVLECGYNNRMEEQPSYVQTPYISSFGEQEYSMYNDDPLSSNPPPFDPLKYPEEPREVDTDEEIDFWAEIEAKKQTEDNDDDDVNFHKSASFWASRERQKSVDETPYKPVLPKPFPAKLPDEPPVQNIDIWQALEAHKGEEPVIVDPQVEEEKALVQEYDEMAQKEVEVDDPNDDAYSVHEPVVASVWCPPTQMQQYPDLEEQNVTENEVDFWAQIEQQKQTEEVKPQDTDDSKNDRDELEIKRSNYRKAMAFFTTSIDENKEQSQERFERGKSKSKRSSRIEEQENEAWDWDAVNEALQQENTKEPIKQTGEVLETPVNEVFDKEQTPQFAIPPPPPLPASAEVKKEETPLPEVFVEPTLKRLPNGLPDLGVNKFYEERKVSVKSRISAFESGAVEQPSTDSRRNSIKNQSLSVESYTRPGSLSRNSSSQRSESEMDEDDSGVTDMNKQLSETDTESESFPELRKMSSYQRAATHSRLFKLLQDDPDMADVAQNADEFQFKPSRRKIVHNVSITRKQNPKALAEAETMSQRRERLSLPLRKNTSIDADNPSTPNSPASPIMGHTANKSSVVSDKLVSELVQSLLLKSDSTHFKNLPMEKLQAAAKRVLEEELDSLENTSVDSTPAMTPNDMKKDKSYADYYNTWSDAQGSEEIVPSKSFRALQDTKRSPWTARCPRVLGSKTINRDLARVTESPEISMRTSKSPECFRQSRENSIGRWKKS